MELMLEFIRANFTNDIMNSVSSVSVSVHLKQMENSRHLINRLRFFYINDSSFRQLSLQPVLITAEAAAAAVSKPISASSF